MQMGEQGRLVERLGGGFTGVRSKKKPTVQKRQDEPTVNNRINVSKKFLSIGGHGLALGLRGNGLLVFT